MEDREGVDRLVIDDDGNELHPLAWWTLVDGELLGVVGLIDRRHRYWKAYIGRVRGPSVNTEHDARVIARVGVPAGEPVARALMPPPLVDGLEFRGT